MTFGGSAAGGGKRQAMFTEINITPLTDIFLVLLIIMMVIAPTFQKTNKAEIKAPKLVSGQAVDANTTMVEITREGQYFINGAAVAGNGLLDNLQQSRVKTGNTSVVLRADENTPNEDVMKVYQAASQARFEKLTVAGEALSEQRQQKLQQGRAS